MDLTGFTKMQRQVIDSVSRVCAQCSDDYWALRDYDEKIPHQLYSALAKNCFIGTALPEEPVLGSPRLPSCCRPCSKGELELPVPSQSLRKSMPHKPWRNLLSKSSAVVCSRDSLVGSKKLALA